MARRPDPWERRDTDTDPSFAAFVVYRDMGADRSLAKVAKEVGKSKALMERWSRAHSWPIRASAWDGEQDRLHRQFIREAMRKSARRNVDVAGAAMAVAATSLQRLVNDMTTNRDRQIRPGDAARLIEVAARLEHLTFGQATEIVGTPGKGPADMGHIEGLSDEDRRARMMQLQRELASRLGEDGAA